MQQPITSSHLTDSDGNPTGGTTSAIGLSISWQNGPLGRGDDREEPNGAFVETVIAAAIDRLEFYNAGKFRCRENSLAITKLEEALHWCQHRTAARETRGVEGIVAWLDDHEGAGHAARDERGAHLLIYTLEGVMRAEPGDYVIRGIKGEFYPCKPDIFVASYDPIVTAEIIEAQS